MKSVNPSERSVVERILTRFRSSNPSAFYYKAHGGPYQMPGLPDIIGCVAGRFLAVEVKRPAEFAKSEHSLRASQQTVLSLLKRAGAAVFVTDGDHWEEYHETPVG